MYLVNRVAPLDEVCGLYEAENSHVVPGVHNAWQYQVQKNDVRL